MLCVELKSKYDLWYFWAVTTAASTQRRIWRAPSSSTTFQPWIAHLCEISHIFSKLPTLPTLLYGLKLFDKKFVNIVIISTLPRWSRSHRRPSPPKSCRCPCLTPARAPPPVARKILSRKSVTKITKINLKPLKKSKKKHIQKLHTPFEKTVNNNHDCLWRKVAWVEKLIFIYSYMVEYDDMTIVLKWTGILNLLWYYVG